MVEIAEKISCPFCSREIDGRLPDYDKKYHCLCGAVYWPEAVGDIAEGQASFLSDNPGDWEFQLVRNFDFLTDDEKTPPTEFGEWVLIFAKKKGGEK